MNHEHKLNCKENPDAMYRGYNECDCLTPLNTEKKLHEPGCGIYMSCLVYHADGICNHPTYGKCTCILNEKTVGKKLRDWEVEAFDKWKSFTWGNEPNRDAVGMMWIEYIKQLLAQKDAEIVKGIKAMIKPISTNNASYGFSSDDLILCRNQTCKNIISLIENK